MREPEREEPPDYSHAPPATPRKDATIKIVVMGDANADWLAYGLEDAFSERPEIGIVRKHRTESGLIRYDQRRDSEWPQIAREIISAEKPQYIVMMVGNNDRQPIRERAPFAVAPKVNVQPPAKGNASGLSAGSAAHRDLEQQTPEPPQPPEHPNMTTERTERPNPAIHVRNSRPLTAIAQLCAASQPVLKSGHQRGREHDEVHQLVFLDRISFWSSSLRHTRPEG